METLDRMPYAAKNAVFQRLASISSLAELSREERRAYDHALKEYRDIYTFETEAKRHLEEAFQKGWEQGFEQGIKRGKIIVAKNMHEYGISLDLICKCTGFSKDFLEKILSEGE